jgi:hypothetical protein
MRCKTCGYRLWHLTEQRCPECGTPFVPSEFEFVIGSVEFHCPHCQQRYFGTGPKGHLVPVAFECVSCHNRVHMDEMILLPAEGVEEEQTKVDRVPWLERKERGPVKAWFATIGMALVTPMRLMRALPMASPGGQAWWFALLTTVVIACVAIIPVVALELIVMAAMGAPVGQMAGPFGIFFLCAGVFQFGFMALWGLTMHGLLRLTGPTAGTIGRTYQALCYSAGANVVSAVPCLGLYLGWVWWIVSAVLMVKEAQRVHGGRATLAVLTLPVLSIVGFVGLMVWFAVAGASAASSMTMSSSYGGMTETQTVLHGVLRYAQQHGGRGPRHAVELVTGDYLTGSTLVSSTSMTTEETVPVGNITLDRLLLAPKDAAGRIAQAVIDALPRGTVAHRLGDFVFTHHGVDFNTADPRLWIVVRWPDPVRNSAVDPNELVCVGLADGTVSMLPQSSMPTALAEQNTLRAAQKLPPLPDPRTVTHAQPATAPSAP